MLRPMVKQQCTCKVMQQIVTSLGLLTSASSIPTGSGYTRGEVVGVGSRADECTSSTHTAQLTGFAIMVLDGHILSTGELSDQ